MHKIIMKIFPMFSFVKLNFTNINKFSLVAAVSAHHPGGGGGAGSSVYHSVASAFLIITFFCHSGTEEY